MRDSGTEKNKSCGGQKGVEQNASENDGYGKTVVAKAQSNVKHHAQTPFTEHFLKGTKTTQCPDAASNDAIPVANHISGGFHIFCHRRHVKPHFYFAKMRFVFLLSHPH